MKLKNIFILAFIIFFCNVNSQTRIHFNNLKNTVDTTFFKPLTKDSTKITSINMLNTIWFSTTVDYRSKILPEKYNWYLDAFRISSYKRMIFDLNKQDRYGRDFLINSNQEMINQIYYKDNKLGF